MLNPENIYTSNVIQAKQVVCMYDYTYMYITSINELRGYKLNESKEGMWEGLEIGKEETMQLQFQKGKENLKSETS